MKRTTIVEIISVLYIILFIYTGISKIMEYDVFTEQIAQVSFLKPFSEVIAVAVPATEFLISFLLIIPAWRFKGLCLALLLMSLFTTYIFGILLMNDQLPCSCGGIISELSWTQHLVFNSTFIMLATIGLLCLRGEKRKQKARLNLIRL